MAKPDMAGWFDANWMRQRDRAKREGFDALARREQVLVAVGFLIDSCIGEGVWAVVDGVVEGQDEGLTRQMPTALDEIGASDAAKHVREIVNLRSTAGTPEESKTNRDRAVQHWQEIERIFDECVPRGERVLLIKLYDWYHAQSIAS